MLFIGDIHITSKYKDRLIQDLRDFVAKNASEEHIVFLGDYVYHFSYDRAAILALYHFFVELFEQGKSVYVLAGNHDRLGNSFVFEEAQKAFSIIQKYDSFHKGNLFFITEPTHFLLEGQNILFFPFMLQVPEYLPSLSPSWLNSIEYLQTSSNKNEQISWKINRCLAYFLEKYPQSLVIHHYYFNKTKLPNQKSLFGYRDIALSGDLLDLPQVSFISGHLHQACSYKNYLCTGSVWFTSPLEINHEKFLFSYTHGTYKAIPIRINPYFQIESTQKINEQQLKNIFYQQNEQSKQHFVGTQIMDVYNSDFFPWQSVAVTLVSERLDYEHIEEYIDDDIFSQLGQVKLKKQSVNTDELLEKLTLASGENQSFGDWKQLLKDYLHQKYSGEYNEYESILQELKVL